MYPSRCAKRQLCIARGKVTRSKKSSLIRERRCQVSLQLSRGILILDENQVFIFESGVKKKIHKKRYLRLRYIFFIPWYMDSWSTLSCTSMDYEKPSTAWYFRNRAYAHLKISLELIMTHHMRTIWYKKFEIRDANIHPILSLSDNLYSQYC